MKSFLAVLLLAVILVSAGPASARPKHFYSDKKFWISEAVIGAAIFLDYHSTAARPYGRESSPLLGTHPSSRRVAAIGFLDFGVESGFNVAFYKIARMGGPSNETRTWNTLGYISQPAISLAVHLPAAVHNYKLEPGRESGILK